MIPSDALVAATGIHSDAKLFLFDREVAVRDGSALIPISSSIVPDGMVELRLESPWLAEPYRRRVGLSGQDTSVFWSHFGHESRPALGRFSAENFQGRYVLFSEDDKLMSDKRGLVGSQAAQLSPGVYRVGLRQEEDPYLARIEEIVIKPGVVEKSVRYQLDGVTTAIAGVDSSLRKRRVSTVSGWNLIGAAAASFASSIYAGLQGQTIAEQYETATLSADLARLHKEAEQMGLLFGASIAAGAGGTLAGTLLLFHGSSGKTLIQEKQLLQQQLNTLSAEAARQAARYPVLARWEPVQSRIYSEE